MTPLRRCLSTLAVALLALVPATAAHAAPTATPLTTVASAAAPLSAYGGWVVWSEPDAEGKWSLWAWHAGVKRRLEVQRRNVPFDADLGRGADGAPTVAFSWCATDPSPAAPLPSATAVDCKPYALRLHEPDQPGGPSFDATDIPYLEFAERDRSRSTSISTPSVWGDRVAYQLRAKGADVAQIVLYDQKTKRRTVLRHGLVPHDCPYANGCPRATYAAEVGELDLGPRTLAFTWHVAAPAATGVGPVWEARAERLSDRRTLLAGSGYVSGACGARTPFSPNATSDGLVFLSRWYHCEAVEGTLTRTTFAAGGRLDRTDDVGGQVAWRIARDAGTGATYALLGAARRDTQTGQPVPAGPLTLALLHGATYEHTGKRASEPFVTGS